MKIIDIRKFRDFFKTNIREIKDNNRDPHFAGVNKNSKYGFFEITNGLGDIENKLSTILDIAGDQQAIYEFMQNAVDANSKNFYISKFGTEKNPYLIVLNDGDYFTVESIVSILAIGSSSKYRDPDTIGQFGVGFKLAHRLIGADNSIHELLKDNKGPILFSWNNFELGELAALDNFDNVTKSDPKFKGQGIKESTKKENYPWLFKIIATNFPCQFNDPVNDVEDRPFDSLFTTKDENALIGGAKYCIKNFNVSNKFKTGTLLVIPLHPKKVDHVFGTIPKGLDVATTVIRKRSGKNHDITIQIENENLLSPKLNSAYWEIKNIISNSTNDNKRNGIIEIEFLYSPNAINENPFEDKPQIYRYFPMSLEQHDFRFAIHCSEFRVTSDRTQLTECDANNDLMNSIVGLLEKEIKEYCLLKKEEFIQLYLSLLLSRNYENSHWISNHNWLEHSFWKPILNLLNRNIPIKENNSFSLSDKTTNRIKIRNSSLPIDTWFSSNIFEWFFWDAIEFPIICLAASQKIGLKYINLLDVLSVNSNIVKINDWLLQSNQNPILLLKELNESDLTNFNKELIWRNVKELKLWLFDQNIYSIEDLSKNDDLRSLFLLNYGPLNNIKIHLEKVGIKISTIYLDEYKFVGPDIRDRFQNDLHYLRNFDVLINVLNQVLIHSGNNLTIDEKIEIFQELSKSITDKTRRLYTLKKLALFRNKRSEIKALFQIVAFPKLPQMLNDWMLHDDEIVHLKDLNLYLSFEKEDIYENIIKPFWIDIIGQSNVSPEDIERFFNFVKDAYNLKPSMGSLDSSHIFLSEKNTDGIPFYHNNLIALIESEYKTLSSVLKNVGYVLPHFQLLSFYSAAPFLLELSDNLIIPNAIKLTQEDTRNLTIWMVKTYPDLLNKYIFLENNEGDIHISKNKGKVNYICNSITLVKYITDYDSKIYVQLPKILHDIFRNQILSKEDLLEKLLYRLCEKFNDKIDIEVVNQNQLLSFSNIIFCECGDRLKLLFLNKITSTICISDIIQPDSIEHIILKICFSITDLNKRIIILRSLVSIKLYGVLRRISTLHDIASDTIEITDDNKDVINFSVSNLLGGIDNNINQFLDIAFNNLNTLQLDSISNIRLSLGMNKPRDIQNIITRLINKLQTNTIENGDQLAFICIISKGNQYPDFKQRDYFVNTKSGKQPIKHKSFFKNICDFIPEEKILLKDYNSFFELLKIKAKGVYHYNGTIFQMMPFLNNYRQLVIHGVQSLTVDQQVQLWRFLFNEWKELNEPTNINLPSGIDSWKNILGLDIHKLITDDDYSLDEEKIPYSLLYEYGLSDALSIKAFLRALGANSNFSAVVSTRKYFETKIGSINMNMSNTQLIQTLKWISIKEIEVDNDDIGPFYRHLHNIRATLSYFPAYFPHTVKQKIVSIEGNANVYHILEKDLIQARLYKIGISDIVNKLSFPLINLQILKDWSAYLQFNNRTKSLNIAWDNLNYHLINTNSVEWNYHFYNIWKEQYPNYKVLQYDGVEIPKQIEVAGQPLGLYNSGIVYQSDDKSTLYVANSTIEILLNTIVNNSYIFDSTARAYLKNCYSDQERQFENYIQIAKKDSEFESILRLRAEEIKLEEERFENANNINDSTSKYTYKWFLSLLELVRVQDKRTKVPELTFFKCQNVSNSNETFELSEYNGLIPSNIESIDEIPAQVIFLSKKNEQITENTTIHASKKQLKLWVIFPDINILSALKNAKKIISVKLLFPQNQELIQKLKNGFLRLNYKEDKNLYEDLSKNIDFVFGPPGTGKTTKLAKDIISFVSGNLINSIIVLTPTNKAADVLTLRIIDQLGNAPKWLFRIGTCTEPKLIKHGVVKSENYIELNSTFSQVIVTTIHRFSYFEVAVNKSNKLRLCDYKWSKVIFDEASMIPVSYITHAIHSSNQLNGNTHFIVSGDPLQIPPVFDLITEDLDQDIADKLQEENIYSMIGLNSFDSNIQKTIPNYGTRIQNLEIQHRSISPIGELFSKFQYQGKLTHSRDNKSNGKKHKKLPQGLVDLGFKPITIIRYPVKSGDSIYKPKKLDKSPIHLYSALLVHEIIKKFEEELTKVSKKGEPWSIGILSPYRSQADLLLKLIETQFKKTDYLNFNVDTVHGFQGDENNIVFAVFNPSGSGSNISFSRFLKKEFILNVAISRAEDYLIMLIPDDDSDGINQLPLIKNLIKLSRETNKEYFSEIKSSDIEKKIMGETKFFENKSFTTAHQKVNIYGKPDLRYIIKLNENSLDIHWDL